MENSNKPIKRKMKDWSEDERKKYFREYYHKKINIADRCRIQKIVDKPMVLEQLICDVGIAKLLEIHMNMINKENKNLIINN